MMEAGFGTRPFSKMVATTKNEVVNRNPRAENHDFRPDPFQKAHFSMGAEANSREVKSREDSWPNFWWLGSEAGP